MESCDKTIDLNLHKENESEKENKKQPGIPT